MRVKLGSVVNLAAAGSGYGIGLDDDGHRVEFIGDWREMAGLQPALGIDPVYVEVENWQVLAIDDELRIPLTREIMSARTRFLRSALRGGG
jgi:hypothetical protein